jgi:hypothetical protein
MINTHISDRKYLKMIFKTILNIRESITNTGLKISDNKAIAKNMFKLFLAFEIL